MQSSILSRNLWFVAFLCLSCSGTSSQVEPPRASSGLGSHAPSSNAADTAENDVASSSAEIASQPVADPAEQAEPYEFPSGLKVSGVFSQHAGDVPANTTVLHIGDSFAGALGGELNKLFEARGIRGVLKFKVPSYIPEWASGPNLPKYLNRYRPDLVLITLGANEMEIGEPEKRAPKIRRLVARIGETPCVWIAPALWGKDNGLLEVIRQNVAPCRYLDTNAIVEYMPRAGDKVHPNMAARPDWAELVLRWLAKERVGAAAKEWLLRPDSAD